MAMLKLVDALLFWKIKPTQVHNNENTPIGDWDTEMDDEAQVFHAMAVMSHASGGYAMNNAVLSVHPDGWVTLFGNGFRITWGQRPTLHGETPADKALSYERMIQMTKNTKILFGVITDQLPESWKRAEKVYPKQVESGSVEEVFGSQ